MFRSVQMSTRNNVLDQMIPTVSAGVLVLMSIFTGFFATVTRISVTVLHGLHAYLLPEEGDQEAFDSLVGGPEGEENENSSSKKKKKKPLPPRFIRPGKKGKKGHNRREEAGGGQILRINLAESQLETRKYFQEYDKAIIYSLFGLVNFLTRETLQLLSKTFLSKYEWAKDMIPGDRISFMVGVFAAYKVLRLLASVGYEPRLSRTKELLLNWAVGVVGFGIACVVLIVVPNSVVDFGIDGAVLDAGKSAALFLQKKGLDAPVEYAVSPTSVKLLVAICAGIVSGLLFGAALRNVKNFWLGTYELGWNIALLKRSLLVKLFLYISIVLPVLVSLSWVKPMAEELIIFPGSELPTVYEDVCAGSVSAPFGALDAHSCVQTGISAAGPASKLQDITSGSGVIRRFLVSSQYDWAADLGFTEKAFSQIQLWGLFLFGLLQVCLFRVNLQSYCNGAVLSWYENMHKSKVKNPEVTKARIFLNNYFVCRVAIQSLLPGVLVLLFLGLARTRGVHLDESAQQGAFFFAPSFVRALMLFMAWWVALTWALQTSVVLVLFRFRLLISTA